jgi:hypothetical protein
MTTSPRSGRPCLDLFLASFKRPEKLGAMLESVRAAGYPVRVLVAAGDLGTVETCEQFKTSRGAPGTTASSPALRPASGAPFTVECIYCTAMNSRIGCTAPLNLVFRSLVRNDALFCTDDCVFEPDAFEVAMTTLYERFPDTDGVVGLAQENIDGAYDLAFPLLGRKFLDRFRTLPGEFTCNIGLGQKTDIFWPGYFHLYNDAEIGLTIKCMGNWVFEPKARLRHFHPVCGGGTMDPTHDHGLTYKREDAIAWTARRAAGRLWGLDA